MKTQNDGYGRYDFGQLRFIYTADPACYCPTRPAFCARVQAIAVMRP